MTIMHLITAPLRHRLACALWVALLLFASAGDVGAQITISQPKAKLEAAVAGVKQHTHYRFFYADALKGVSVNAVKATDAKIEAVLEQMLKGTGIAYRVSGDVIYLTRADAPAKANAPQGEKRKVSGVVRDENGEPVIGATIRVPGTNEAAVTDMDGNYTLDVPAGGSFVISYLGYANQTVSVKDGKDNVDVSLKPEAESLSEVVVTALGIKKEAKALSYNVQQVNSSELTGVKDANFVNALSGKVAGVVINTSSAGIGGGAKVVMRGAKSLSGNNNALYVIDGIPMPQLQTSQPSDFYSGQGQSGDGASMLNPEDIESMSVLSGAAASALYGSEAQNGVIMITTKKGQAGRTDITYANNTAFFTPFITPEFQNTYGAATGEFASWGAKLNVPSQYNPLDFFQTGHNVMNAVSLRTGNDKNQTFISLASTNAEGLVMNNTLDRYNVSIRNTSTMFKDKLHLDLGATYMSVKENNMISEGQYLNPVVPVYLMSPSYSLDAYKHYEIYDAARDFKTQNWQWGNMGLGMQNPYWTAMRDNLPNHKNRFMFSAGLTYDIAKGIRVAARAKVDYTSGLYERKYSASTDGILADTYGFYQKDDESTRQIYGDVVVSFDKYFGDFSLTANVGAAIQDVNYRWNSLGGNLSSVANLFAYTNLNLASLKPDESRYHDQTQSVFATAQLGWKSKIYLDLTARADWASALAGTGSSAVAYPSAGLTAILTDLIPGLKCRAVSFLKVRGSYSEVGNAPKRYIAYQTYPILQGTPTTSTTYPNTDIRPERTKAWEVGLESHFWGDKLNLNISLYKTSTYNQLFNPALSSTSGYKSIYINGGQIDNKGIEVSLTLKQPIGPVDWQSTLTYSINRNRVVQLLKPTTLAGGMTVAQDHLDLVNLGNVKTMLTEGGSMGDLYVRTLMRDSHGYVYIDYATNETMVDKTAGPYHDGYIKAGNADAKYNLGWRNTLSWKGLTLGFHITARVGGECVSLTQGLMDAYGVSRDSAADRDLGYVLVDGHKVPAVQKWYQTVGTGTADNYVYSATNVRLAELSLGYDVPVQKLVPWIKGMNVAFTGRNLFMLYCKAPYDPELTPSTGTGFAGMDYFMLPSMRNLGFSVRLNF